MLRVLTGKVILSFSNVMGWDVLGSKESSQFLKLMCWEAGKMGKHKIRRDFQQGSNLFHGEMTVSEASEKLG